MTIRPCKSSDAPQVVELVSGILAREFSEDQAAYPVDDLQRLSETYRGPNGLFLVAEDAGRIVGTCGVKAEDSHTAILRRLFVDASCRGKGIGRGLLEEAVAFCRKRGFRDVWIRTSARMDRAIRLCRALGFQEEGRWTLGEVTLVRYRLRLA